MKSLTRVNSGLETSVKLLVITPSTVAVTQHVSEDRVWEVDIQRRRLWGHVGSGASGGKVEEVRKTTASSICTFTHVEQSKA